MLSIVEENVLDDSFAWLMCVRVRVYVCTCVCMCMWMGEREGEQKEGGRGERKRRGEEKEEMISECPRAMQNRKNACQRVFRGRIKDKNCTLFEIKFIKC